MRLELAPLGIKVATLATGGVSTQFSTNLNEPKLAEDTMYEKAQEGFDFIASGQRSQKGMDPRRYADNVVRDLMGGAKGLIWRGTGATMAKWLTKLAPQFVLVSLAHYQSRSSLTIGQDYFLIKAVGLDKMY